MKINAELYHLVKNAKDAQALMALYHANGLEMTQEAAERVIDIMRTSGEIATDELVQCTGGGDCGNRLMHYCPYCGSHNTYYSPTNLSGNDDDPYWYGCLDCGKFF